MYYSNKVNNIFLQGDSMHWLFIVLIAIIVIYVLAGINMRMAAKNLVG